MQLEKKLEELEQPKETSSTLGQKDEEEFAKETGDTEIDIDKEAEDESAGWCTIT